MPKKSKYPRLRVSIKRGRAGQVWTAYSYDMRGTGEKDIPLGHDLAEAVRRWDEIHNRRPRIAGTIEEAFERWEREKLPAYASAETRRGYAKNLRTIRPVFQGARWDEVTLQTLRDYLRDRPAKTQANREMSLLGLIWNWARMESLTDLAWPAHDLKRVSWKNPEGVRELEEGAEPAWAAIYAAGDQVLRDCMDLNSATGMRLTDCRTVRLPAGDLLQLKASKTGKRADFDLSLSAVLPELVARRRALKCDHVMLLSTPEGRPVSAGMLRDRFDQARLLARWQAAMVGDHCHDDERAAAAAYASARAIAALILRDGRKLAADAVETDEQAAELLQHASVGLTRKHYRTRAPKLAPVK